MDTTQGKVYTELIVSIVMTTSPTQKSLNGAVTFAAHASEDSMVVGDLVTLSAYGAARQHNREIVNQRGPEQEYQVGIVTKVYENRAFPFLVKWQRSTNTLSYPGFVFHRRELKHAGW